MVRYDMVFTHIADTDVDVDLLIDQIHRSIQYLQIDLQSWVHFDEFGQHGRYVVSSESGTRGDAQSSADLDLGLLQSALELLVNIQYALGPREHQLAPFSHRHVSSGSVK